MVEENLVNITTQYPIDIYGATFYYKISKDNIIKIYHNSWEGMQGTGKTIQSAIENMIENMKKLYEYVFSKYDSQYIHKDYELIKWMEKVIKLTAPELSTKCNNKRGCF